MLEKTIRTAGALILAVGVVNFNANLLELSSLRREYIAKQERVDGEVRKAADKYAFERYSRDGYDALGDVAAIAIGARLVQAGRKKQE
jgi:hypothetical protein